MNKVGIFMGFIIALLIFTACGEVASTQVTKAPASSSSELAQDKPAVPIKEATTTFKKPETYNSSWFSFAVDFPTEQNYKEMSGRIVKYRDDCYLVIDQFAEGSAKERNIDISAIIKPDQILNGLGKQVDDVTYNMHGAPSSFKIEIDNTEEKTINGFDMVKQKGSIYRPNVTDSIGKYGFMAYATFVSGKPVYIMIVDGSKDQRYFKGDEKAYTLTQALTMEEIIDGMAQTIRTGEEK